MAHDFDTTVGGSASNAYITVQGADHYHESHRLYSTTWNDPTNEASKEAAIKWATRLLDDGLVWAGNIASYDQALSWPRTGVVDKEGRIVDEASIPEAVQFATAELAQRLIESDRTADPDTLGFKSIKVGPIELEIDKYDELQAIPEATFDLVRHIAVRAHSPGSGNVGLMRR